MNKILIADDTKSWIVFHKTVIKNVFGDFFEITTAESAKDAINLVKQNISYPFDIIITDLQMENDYEPKLAGEWLIEQIQDIRGYSSKKIIVISAMYNIEDIAKKYKVECISKNMLIRNPLLLKFMFEKLMPSLVKLNGN